MDRVIGWITLHYHQKNKACKTYRLSLVINVVVLLWVLMLLPGRVYAQWPPFNFRLTPSYESGQIIYDIQFFSQADWTITDVAIKIPLPEGTRFVEANAQSGVDVEFDGTEVTFFASTLHRDSIRDTSFIVRVVDPTNTIFTTHAWIAWEGNQPGNYLTTDVSIDITRQSLNWEEPPATRLQLEASAIVADDIVTYLIYPKNVKGARYVRLQDVRINVPVPEGTTFLSAEASSPFTASFDGKEVSFFALELEWGVEIGPLQVKVSTEEVAAPLLVTHAWATWKNVGYAVGRTVVAQEEVRSGDISVQPHIAQWVVSDPVGDVPFPNYDVTNLSFQASDSVLKITFYTVGDLGPVGEPLQYVLYIDSDCQADTGQWKNYRGVEYQVRYIHGSGRAYIVSWDEETEEWALGKQIKLSSLATGKSVAVWVPYDLLESSQQFCWLVEARNGSQAFDSYLPTERIPSGDELRLSQYEIVATTPEIEIEFLAASPSNGTFIDVGDTWQVLPGWSEPPSNWQTIDFDDSDWFSGPTSIGYGDGDYATDLSLITRPVQNDGTPILVQRVDRQSGMILAILASGDSGPVFMRRVFTHTHSILPTRLTLEINYEGGFVAYLNDQEVARRGLGESGSPISYDALATSHESSNPEVIDLNKYVTGLISGTNVLAIQAHSVDGTNLSITPKLTWEFNPADISASTNLPSGSNIVASIPPTTSLVTTNIRGKLAVPLDNGQNAYDVYVFSLPDGREIIKIPNARQPNFRFDGQRMLINREGGGIENVFEYNFTDGTEKQVSDAPQDWHPFYDPWGNRVVYGNSELTVGADGLRHPYIFVQCGLRPPHQEVESHCQNIPWLGILIPAGQMGEIQGTHPVWTANDMIAYKGCNSWAGFSACGIYITPSSSTKGLSNGFIPRQLTKDASDIPSDTKGDLIAFTSRRDGNWEAYIMDLNGAGVRNVSNSPNSNDGLPTISPDGNWIAFVSDRDDQWAIWAVPVAGGSAQKLFNLPIDTPWSEGNRTWTNERISWGP